MREVGRIIVAAHLAGRAAEQARSPRRFATSAGASPSRACPKHDPVSEGIAGPALTHRLRDLSPSRGLALVLTPLVRRIADRFDVLDRPEARRVNTSPIPRGGGIAVAAAFVITSLGVIVADACFGIWPATDAPAAREVVALVGGAALAALLGSLDDWFDLRARWQLAGQLVLAGSAVGLGITVTLIANPFGPGFIHLGGIFEAGFTVLWVLGMINSINFIDGLDGLSSGVALIAALTLGTISLTTDRPARRRAPLLRARRLAPGIPALEPPSGLDLPGDQRRDVRSATSWRCSRSSGAAKVAVALLVLGVPIIDTFWIIVRRVSEGRSPFSPDRGHIHHRLLDLGLSHARPCS
jgi:UDP-GlcNAc:undecaprenyl-phosphate GlcNAc-1-phosphate transferase